MERCQSEWLQATIKAPTGYIHAFGDLIFPVGARCVPNAVLIYTDFSIGLIYTTFNLLLHKNISTHNYAPKQRGFMKIGSLCCIIEADPNPGEICFP
jgi:hypothetical protein